MIDEAKKAYPLKEVCRLAQMPRSSYYAKKRQASRVDPERVKRRAEVLNIHRMTDRSYGSRRMSQELRRRGYPVGRYQAAALMRESGIEAHVPKPHRYPKSGAASNIAPNRLNREFDVAEANRVWAGDITYLWTQKGWLYLAVVVDLFSRRVVGWAFSTSADTALVSRALRLALVARRPAPGLLFHSDQGCQYTSKAFGELLSREQIIQSMSRRGNCWDNAVVERFFRSLKAERVRNQPYPTHAAAQGDVSDYIAQFYNTVRLHSAAGDLPPVEYEQKQLKIA